MRGFLLVLWIAGVASQPTCDFQQILNNGLAYTGQQNIPVANVQNTPISAAVANTFRFPLACYVPGVAPAPGTAVNNVPHGGQCPITPPYGFSCPYVPVCRAGNWVFIRQPNLRSISPYNIGSPFNNPNTGSTIQPQALPVAQTFQGLPGFGIVPNMIRSPGPLLPLLATTPCFPDDRDLSPSGVAGQVPELQLPFTHAPVMSRTYTHQLIRPCDQSYTQQNFVDDVKLYTDIDIWVNSWRCNPFTVGFQCIRVSNNVNAADEDCARLDRWLTDGQTRISRVTRARSTASGSGNGGIWALFGLLLLIPCLAGLVCCMMGRKRRDAVKQPVYKQPVPLQVPVYAAPVQYTETTTTTQFV